MGPGPWAEVVVVAQNDIPFVASTHTLPPFDSLHGCRVISIYIEPQVPRIPKTLVDCRTTDHVRPPHTWASLGACVRVCTQPMRSPQYSYNEFCFLATWL